jgi:hypothetical protein
MEGEGEGVVEEEALLVLFLVLGTAFFSFKGEGRRGREDDIKCLLYLGTLPIYILHIFSSSSFTLLTRIMHDPTKEISQIL